jgi:mono/diheme cytochrome c family protein
MVHRIAAAVFLILLLSLAHGPISAAPIDATGTWDGRCTPGGGGAPVDVAAVLSASGATLSGTVAVGAGEGELDGAYVVQGRTRGRRVKLSGVGPDGARLAWRGRATASGLRGRLKVRRGAQRLVGPLALARRTLAPIGGSCDDPFFTDQVMARVLVPTCATCHVPGGQAGATSLLVDAHDVAGTQGRVAQQVDAADPARSPLLLKPLGIVPHGGGTQLAADSEEAAILRQWADVVASGACGTPPPPRDAYAAQCASCHGADARGTDVAPSVRCSVHVRSVVRKGRGRGAKAMPAFPASVLPDADLDAILSTLATACAASGDARPADLFLGNCAGCHGDTGGGGRDARNVPGPSIRCEDAGAFLERVPRGGDGMPAFPELSRDDVRAMHDWVHGFCR